MIEDPSDTSTPAERLAQWWRDLAESDIAAMTPKAKEYSAYDLDLIGRVMADTIGFKDPTQAEREELGCFFYLLGKVGRMAGAYREGRLPSGDTWLDARIYSTMASRIRDVGEWPGV